MDVLHDCLTNPQIPADLKLEGPADTAVIVIGESAARAHLSLYGYGRETTPALDAKKDELVVFRNVISARPVTTPPGTRQAGARGPGLTHGQSSPGPGAQGRAVASAHSGGSHCCQPVA